MEGGEGKHHPISRDHDRGITANVTLGILFSWPFALNVLPLTLPSFLIQFKCPLTVIGHF
jgi:hypothetical protein